MKAGAASQRALYVRLALMSLFWGGTFTAARVAVQDFPPFFVATARMVFAGAVLLPILVREEGGMPRISARQAAAVVALGVLGFFLYNILFLGAMKVVPASRAALIVPLNASITPLAAWALFGERLSAWQLLGVALALSGGVIVVTHGDIAGALQQGIGFGELLLLGCVVSWVAYTLVIRSLLRGLSPVAATTYAMLAGGAMLAVPAVWEVATAGWPSGSAASWSAIAFLGVFGTAFGFVWYNQGIQGLGAGRAAVFINLVPVFGVLFGIVFLGEPILTSMILGGAIVVLGVALTNRVRAAAA